MSSNAPILYSGFYVFVRDSDEEADEYEGQYRAIRSVGKVALR